MDVQSLLKKENIIPDPLNDQFFLTDDISIKKLIDLADLRDKDVVLEIGTGIGNITRELAKKSGKVIAFEIDERFKPLLTDLPKNVDLRFEDAWEYVKLHGKSFKKREYNKVVANIPYSFAEKFLHNLTFLIYDKVILVLPQSLVKKIEVNPIFGSFFKVEEKLKIDKNKFYPVPRTNSVIINLIKLPDAIATKNLSLFLRQHLYQYEYVKTKNSLREGLIKYTWLTKSKRLTKKEAKKILGKSGIDKNLLEKKPDNPEIYQETEKLELK